MNKPVKAVMMSVQGTSLRNEEKFLLSKYNPLGISLFGRNISNKAQLQMLVDEVKNVLNRDDVLFAVDQEGGRVRRLAEPEWRAYAPQYALNEEAALYHTQLIANDLKEVGINLNYAPVLDICFEQTAKVLKSRCFGNDEKVVAKLGRIMVDEYVKNGICPCIKHMPGHGRVVVDPHLGLPVLDYSLKELEKDFYPFQELSDAPMGMTAHIVIPEVDAKHPITQSKEGIERIIRGVIGFKGFLMSDALDMRALSGSMAEKALKALDAGVDAVCYYSASLEEATEMLDKAGVLGYNKLDRLYEIIARPSSLPSISDVAKKYYAIVGNVEQYVEDYDATETLKHMKKS